MLNCIKCTLITFMVSLVCSAQPTLNDSTSNPVLGDQFVFYNTNYVSPGNPGANQIWNLSSLNTASIASYTVQPPSNSQFYSGFLAANIGITNGSSYDFYRADSAALLYQGNGTFVNYQYVTHKYQNILKYPFHYLDNFTDSFTYTYYAGGPFVSNSYGGGVDTVLADGFGTLILPNATYNNTLRVHYKTHINSNNSLNGPDTVRIDEYKWFARNYHMPLAVITAFTENGTTSLSGQYLFSSINGLTDYNSGIFNLNIYPNPASKEISIERPIKGKITITNIFGEIVQIPESEESLTLVKMDLSGLCNGIYFVNVLSEKLNTTQKIIVSH